MDLWDFLRVGFLLRVIEMKTRCESFSTSNRADGLDLQTILLTSLKVLFDTLIE